MIKHEGVPVLTEHEINEAIAQGRKVHVISEIRLLATVRALEAATARIRELERVRSVSIDDVRAELARRELKP